MTDEKIAAEQTTGADGAQFGDALAYRCPNCSAGLVFDPEKGKFACEFCLSEFSREELDKTDAAQKAQQAEAEAEDYCAHMNAYRCPTCGAEVIADENTAADFCCYCHNPIILQGRLVGQMRPDKVVPFSVGMDGAKDAFLRWAKRRIFAPGDFSGPEQLGKMQGVYYPFWVTDADTDSNLTARATRTRTWRSGDRIYTETSRFRVERQGDIHFEDLTTAALSDADKEMLEGILPYPSAHLVPFAPSYLTGFVAKKRDIERKQLTGEVRDRMQKYATELLRGTVSGYATVAVEQCDVRIFQSHWDYSLLPIWLLVYRGKKKDYVFAMNGDTGKIYGKVPLCLWKLLVFAFGVAAVAFGLLWLIGGALL